MSTLTFQLILFTICSVCGQNMWIKRKWKQLLCVLWPKSKPGADLPNLSMNEGLDLQRTVPDSWLTSQWLDVPHRNACSKSFMMKMKSMLYDLHKVVIDWWRDGVRLHTLQTETKLTNSEDCCGLGISSLIVILSLFWEYVLKVELYHSDENLLHPFQDWLQSYLECFLSNSHTSWHNTRKQYITNIIKVCAN